MTKGAELGILDTYHALELELEDLDDAGDDELAEKLRTVMDFIWEQRLTKEERELLGGQNELACRQEMRGGQEKSDTRGEGGK